MFQNALQVLAGCARRSIPPGTVWRVLAQVLGVAWLLAGANASPAQEAASKEYQIKAAYLYNFAKFVEWPAGSFTNSQAPLVIGVYGQNPFGDALQDIARDHKINGRDIVIKSVSNAAETGSVQVLFVGASEDERAGSTLALLADKSVLTVGETETFAKADGIIRFVREGDKIRFEINNAAAERHGLKISAQLLKLATTVRKNP